MTLIDEIENTRKKIKKCNRDIGKLGRTRAEQLILLELVTERKDLYLHLGRLCANSGVLICLR